MTIFQNCKRIVVKVGTSTLTYPSGRLNLDRMEKLARELSDLCNRGLEVTLVTSGAIGAGLARLGWPQRPKTLPEKQAVAAVGQSLLMQVYEKFFSEYGQVVAQVLLTREDLAHRDRYLNARQTLKTLLGHGVIPIANENDTVAVEEIRFGDNDTLSALLATLVQADLLIILSDVPGLYSADPRQDPQAQFLSEINCVDEKIVAGASGAGSQRGTGGMRTKLEAAQIATTSGIPLVIADGGQVGLIGKILDGEEVGTFFTPKAHALAKRKQWLAFSSKTVGEIWVDAGAHRALVEKCSSLLPSGVIRVMGPFTRGDLVRIADERGHEFARGLVNYSAEDLSKIQGRRSHDIHTILGSKDYDEVVHRDNLVCLE